MTKSTRALMALMVAAGLLAGVSGAAHATNFVKTQETADWEAAIAAYKKAADDTKTAMAEILPRFNHLKECSASLSSGELTSDQLVSAGCTAEWRDALMKEIIDEKAKVDEAGRVFREAQAAHRKANPDFLPTIGMTEDEARETTLFGQYQGTHTTTTTGHTRTQVVYSHGYLYFTDGILTAIQN